jgi:ribosomal protein S18 acetylase RimI-like enzyme
MSPTMREARVTLYNSHMLDGTQDLNIAKSWATEILKDKNPAKYYLSQENFIAAYRNENTFSFCITGEPFYGHLYGEGAYLDPRCSDLAVTPLNSLHNPEFSVRGGGFQFWEAQTRANENEIELLSDHDEIKQLIDSHAPDSSVRPGDKEEIFWAGLRNQYGQLAAAAVIVKWQSGCYVAASVVTKSSERGNGYATRLMQGIVSHAHSLGIQEIGLGVRPDNIAAQRAYEKSGFTKIGSFTNYTRG